MTEIRAVATESFSLDGSMLLYSEATMYHVQFDLAACLFVAAVWVYLEFALMEILRAVDDHETSLRD